MFKDLDLYSNDPRDWSKGLYFVNYLLDGTGQAGVEFLILPEEGDWQSYSLELCEGRWGWIKRNILPRLRKMSYVTHTGIDQVFQEALREVPFEDDLPWTAWGVTWKVVPRWGSTGMQHARVGWPDNGIMDWIIGSIHTEFDACMTEGNRF